MQRTEYYLTYLDVNKLKPLDFFYFNHKPPNQQWELMVRRKLVVNQIFFYVDRFNLMIPRGEVHHVEMVHYNSAYQRDVNGIYNITAPHINFTDLENKKGNNFIKIIGLKPDDKYVCIIIRDSAYKTHYFTRLNENETRHRNSKPNDYKKAIIYLLNQGYWVFRMGKLVEKSIEIQHPKFFDYAVSELKSDFLDIWINANCYFAVANSTGLDEVQRTFRKPILHVNISPPGQYISGLNNVQSIIKKMKFTKTNDLLSLKRMIDLDVINIKYTSDFEKNGIEYIDNDPNEIKAATVEFDKRLQGLWNESEEYKKLKLEFINTLKSWKDYNRFHGKISGHLSETFLMNNHEWLLKK